MQLISNKLEKIIPNRKMNSFSRSPKVQSYFTQTRWSRFIFQNDFIFRISKSRNQAYKSPL